MRKSYFLLSLTTVMALDSCGSDYEKGIDMEPTLPPAPIPQSNPTGESNVSFSATLDVINAMEVVIYIRMDGRTYLARMENNVNLHSGKTIFIDLLPVSDSNENILRIKNT